MKRNLNAPILQLDGTVFKDAPDLRTVIFLAATTPIGSDQNRPVDYKLKLYSIAQKSHAGGVIDLSSEEIMLLKERIGSVVNHVVIIGRAFELLEDDAAFSAAEAQARFDAAVDARDMPSGATKEPDQYTGD